MRIKNRSRAPGSSRFFKKPLADFSTENKTESKADQGTEKERKKKTTSRFYIFKEIQDSKRGESVGLILCSSKRASVATYLLESTKLIHQARDQSQLCI
jgi:hypothetical protein